MSTNSPRRRVRRAAQTRRVSHPSPGTPVLSAPIPEEAGASADPPIAPGPELSPPAPELEPIVAATADEGDAGPPEREDPDRGEGNGAVAIDQAQEGAWLPAGITLLVMAGLLLCAVLVVIASRR